MRITQLALILFLVGGCSNSSDSTLGGGSGGKGDNGSGGNGNTINPDMATGGGGGTGGEGGGGGGGTGGEGGGGGGGTGGGGGGGGTVGGGGLLKFAVFGDCRPPNIDDTSGYPSAIIGNIFKLAQSKGAQFAVGTGDYMFASQSSAVTAQVQLFKQAAASFTAGPLYLAMGNHECTGATASNCPNLNETPNVQAFMSQLAPAGSTKPYYRIDMDTPKGKAKFVFIAANAWDSTQQSWLTTQLADPTTYTFVVRHESITSSGVPTGVTASEPIVTSHPYTLELLGHTHEYRHVDTQHVISGNAGAPLQSGGNYGLLLVEQGADGNITVTEIDESSGNATDTWKVSPTGQAM